MNGQMMSYERYWKSVKETPRVSVEPPTSTIDFRGLVKFAKAEGKKVTDLTDEEKALFVSK